MPGHNLRSGLGKIALSVIVPEVVFAWLSIAASVPVFSSVLPAEPNAMAFCERLLHLGNVGCSPV
jgi:hypothetical protein